ncbi:MAG: EamA family transporter [Candidatus Pacebacteria bacterium]|nr:EamA family transporter [Candidatus Paceibacterota bacterium]
MWLIHSLLMFLFSNLLYLTIRKAQKEKISIHIYSVTMFLIPAITYLFLIFLTKTSLLLSLPHLVLVIGTAFLWSYLGNYFSQKGILFAPNPGYSLVIQKSYVVLTTIAAVILFGSSISLPKLVGIISILFFVGIISLSGKTHQSESKWVLFSILAHLCFAFGSLMSKQFLNMGLQPYTYLFYITSFVSILNLIEAKRKKVKINLSKNHWILIIIIGLANVGFNTFMQFGYKLAPNPGYVVAINTASIMSLTIFSALIFKDELSKQKVVGVLGVLVGLLIIALA